MNLKKTLLALGLASALIGSASSAKEEEAPVSAVETQKIVSVALTVLDFEAKNSEFPYDALKNTDLTSDKIINILGQNGKVKVIRSTSSGIRDKSSGTFSAHDVIPYTKSCSMSPMSDKKELHCETASVENGYKITLAPAVQDDHSVRIGVDLEYNELQSLEEVNNVFTPGAKIQLPHIKGERQYQTIVLHSGETVVLEAFKNKNRYKIALLKLSNIQ